MHNIEFIMEIEVLKKLGSRTVSELCKLCPKIFHYHWLCPRFANYVRMLQTVSECCKLCPIDANYVRGLQTMSEGCKLCPNRDFRWIFKMQTMSEGCKLCPKVAISNVLIFRLISNSVQPNILFLFLVSTESKVETWLVFPFLLE